MTWSTVKEEWNERSLQYALEESASRDMEVLCTVVQIEHEMDWALSCDTCLDCARLRVWAGLVALFDTLRGIEPSNKAIETLTDHHRNTCPRDSEYHATRCWDCTKE